MGISVKGSIVEMRSLAIIFLSAAAVVTANPCQNNEDVYFPDPEDCGRFFMCVDGSVVGHMKCPDGLLWNTDLLTCDWPRNVECKPGCPEGWSSAGDSCYFLSRQVVKKFSEAQEFCQNMGANLVEINSAEENAIVVGLAEAARSVKASSPSRSPASTSRVSTSGHAIMMETSFFQPRQTSFAPPPCQRAKPALFLLDPECTEAETH